MADSSSTATANGNLQIKSDAEKCFLKIYLDGKSILLDAVHHVLEDASFRTKSPVALEAWRAAAQMKDWCKNDANEPILELFSNELVVKLFKTIQMDAHRIPNRFKLWKLFFSIRSSKQFTQNWETFLSQINVSPTPVLYQHLTDIVFKSLMKLTEAYK
jgi:hypothetical protein